MVKYNWQITGKKFIIAFVEIVIAGGLAYATEHIEWLMLVPILEAARNYIKNA